MGDQTSSNPSFLRNDFVDDPAAVPVRDAATVMVVRDAPELEVLMVERAGRLAFAANAWVFPGGRVDASDAEHGVALGEGLTDAQASAMLDIEVGGLAWWFAVVRETLEEVGLLVGAPGVDAAVAGELRNALDDHGAEALLDSLGRHDLRLDLSGVHEVARFITPVGPPRRFDTRFFLTGAPAGQEPVHDESEIVATRWIRPVDAIGAWRSGELELMAVTHRMLACLERFPTAAAALDRAAVRPDPARLRVIDPDGQYHVLLPGEPGYDTAELEIEHGSIRLWREG